MPRRLTSQAAPRHTVNTAGRRGCCCWCGRSAPVLHAERECTPLLHVFTTCPRRRLRSSLAKLADFFLAFSTIAARRRRTLFASSPEPRTVVIQSPRLLLFGANFHSERGVVRHIPRLRVAETIVAKRTAAFERLVMSA